MLQTAPPPNLTLSQKQFVGETFERQVVEVDGRVYENCKFIECRIIFSGVEAVAFDDCTFVRCDWGFSGAAVNTLSYLSALYQGLGENGREMVDGIFDSVRLGLVESGELLSTPRTSR